MPDNRRSWVQSGEFSPAPPEMDSSTSGNQRKLYSFQKNGGLERGAKPPFLGNPTAGSKLLMPEKLFCAGEKIYIFKINYKMGDEKYFPLVLDFEKITKKDIALVGGKNASLGELINKTKIPVPPGFAITSKAYKLFVEYNAIDKKIKQVLKKYNIKNLEDLKKAGKEIRNAFLKGKFPEELRVEIEKAYRQLGRKVKEDNPLVAVRSSATLEDIENASFAGQQETYLGVKGIEEVLEKTKRCFASLYTNRAISYRQDMGFSQLEVYLSVGVQYMVRSDLACSGVMFTLDPNSGFRNVVCIEASYGLGEFIVQGKVIPDTYYVFKPTLAIVSKELGEKKVKCVFKKGAKGTSSKPVEKKERERYALKDAEIRKLAEYAIAIERYYKRPMDIEWAKDGLTGNLYIVQARPETVHSAKKELVIENYVLKEKSRKMVEGLAIGRKIGVGKINVIRNVKDIGRFQKGEILVTEMTNPDWEPIMKIASGIVTEKGGITCFGGDTYVLTDKGFFKMRNLFYNFEDLGVKYILAYDYKKKEPCWKKIRAVTRNLRDLVRVEISQTGKAKVSTLEVTLDHKFYTFDKRKLVKRRLKDILEREEGIAYIDKVPRKNKINISADLMYLAGIIFSDGYINYSNRRGYVVFTQKMTKDKKALINHVNTLFLKLFQKEAKKREKVTESVLKNRIIRGSSYDFVWHGKQIAKTFLDIYNNLEWILLSCKEDACAAFIAGVSDGDGTGDGKRIQIYVSDERILKALVIASLRIGIVPRVTKNRNIRNLILNENLDKILKYTKRIKIRDLNKALGTRLFFAKQILGDVIDNVNYKGRIKAYVLKNLLIDKRKLERYVLPLCNDNLKEELEKVLESHLGMLRIVLREKLGKQEVFNIEVETKDGDEMEHNYIVFTSNFLPILVSNSHAAIVSRELGVPCIVGAEKATSILKTGMNATLDCTSEKGIVWEGRLKYEIKKVKVSEIPKTKTKVMLILGTPEQAFDLAFLPADGVGLAREENIIASWIKMHPLYAIEKGKEKFYVDKLAEGIGRIASAFYPKEVTVRFSDFKTNEYADLEGGRKYEPAENNPMLGWRGASRYISKEFRPAFELELKAMLRVRDDFGLKNISLLVPFCRTLEEAEAVIDILKEHGLKRRTKVYVMAEIPSNIILAEKFAKLFDGFSIGSNDLTQLTLGMDRDNEKLKFDERNEAVLKAIEHLIKIAKKKGKYVGICGQAPSEYPEYVTFLVKCGIDSISVNPDVFLRTKYMVAEVEREIKKG